MRPLLLTILALSLALPASAAELLIIQSHKSPLFDQTVRQLQNSCGSRNQTYVMSDYAEFDLGRIVREEQPRLLVAVGDRPLKEALKLRNTPVLYTMALTAEEHQQRKEITGISMYASPELYIQLLRKLGLRRAGVVFNKGKSGAYIARAKTIAADYGIELVPAQIKTPQEVENALTRLSASNIDTLWMIPDTTAVTTETLGSYFLMAQKANIALISFSKAYLEKGALAVLEASRRKMTEQLCSKISQIISGKNPTDTPTADISEASLFTNETVARRLGISLSGTTQLFTSDRK